MSDVQSYDVQTYIEKLKIKKSVVGGFDPEAVYAAMQELSSLYEKEIRRLKEEKEGLSAEYRKTSGELKQANEEVQQLRFRLQEGQKNQVQYELRFNALTQAVEAVNAGRDRVIEESRKKAEEMIAEANGKLESIREECRLQKQQKDLLLSEIAEAKRQFGLSVKSLRSTLAKMILAIDSLQKDGAARTPDGARADGKPRTEEKDGAGPLVQMLAGSFRSHDR